MTVSSTDLLMYTKEEYEILRKDLISRDTELSLKHHNGTPVAKTGLYEFVDHILYKHDPVKSEIVDCWLNLSCRKLLFKSSLNAMPLLINHKKATTRIIAKWRLKISK